MTLARWTILSRTKSDERAAIRESVRAANRRSWRGFGIGWVITLAIILILDIWWDYNYITIGIIFIISALYKRNADTRLVRQWKEPDVTEIDYLRPIPEDEFKGDTIE